MSKRSNSKNVFQVYKYLYELKKTKNTPSGACVHKMDMFAKGECWYYFREQTKKVYYKNIYSYDGYELLPDFKINVYYIDKNNNEGFFEVNITKESRCR